MAFKKIADQDEDRAKTYELEQSCVKLMRGTYIAHNYSSALSVVGNDSLCYISHNKIVFVL